MAERMPSAIPEEELSCPICFEDYHLYDEKRKPKLLLCLHTFCLSCIENLLRYNDNLQCSICRARHDVVRLSDLLNNDAIYNHLIKKQEMEDQKFACRIALKEDSESGEEAEMCPYPKQQRQHLRQQQRQHLRQQRRQQQQQYQQPHTSTQNCNSDSPIHERTVFIDDCRDIVVADLYQYLSRYGTITDINVKKRFTFVVFSSPREAERVVGDHFINNKMVEVMRHRSNEFKIFIGGMKDITVEHIKAYCWQHGFVKDCEAPRGQDFCFVTFDRKSAVRAALRDPYPIIFGCQVHIKRFDPSLWRLR